MTTELRTDRFWSDVCTRLLPAIHEVDRNATAIWFALFPFALVEAAAAAPDPGRLLEKHLVRGRPWLAEQADTSHWFLYGHRYWPAVKQAAASCSLPASPAAMAETALALSASLSAVAGTPSLAAGIAAVALKTRVMLGDELFTRALSGWQAVPEQRPADVAARRTQQQRPGLLDRLTGKRPRHRIIFDERRADGFFPLIDGQHLTAAAAEDRRDYAGDPRCYGVDGPIPVECRSGKCGMCWVGVLAGAEHLSPVEPFERQRCRQFGYEQGTEDRPLIRLACQAQATGSISLVVPSWNGVFGTLRNDR